MVAFDEFSVLFLGETISKLWRTSLVKYMFIKGVEKGKKPNLKNIVFAISRLDGIQTSKFLSLPPYRYRDTLWGRDKILKFWCNWAEIWPKQISKRDFFNFNYGWDGSKRQQISVVENCMQVVIYIFCELQKIHKIVFCC